MKNTEKHRGGEKTQEVVVIQVVMMKLCEMR